MIFDTHVHFWNPEYFDYHWLSPDNPLYRPFLPSDVVNEMLAADVAGCIVIEAANTSEEIPWLLSLAKQYSIIKGVIGWLDWDQPGIDSVITRYIKNPYFRGARFNWIEDSWRNVAQVKTNLTVFDNYHLTCDVLTRIEMLPDTLEIIRPYTNTHFVINHFAGATLYPGGAKVWADQVAPAAKLPNIFMKFFGYMTACAPCPVSQETLETYLDLALDLFGEDRLLLATNYPINEVITPEYSAPLTMLKPVLSTLTTNQRKHLLWRNGERAYRLTPFNEKDIHYAS